MFEFIDTPNPNAKKIMVEHNFEISIYLDAESIEDKNLKTLFNHHDVENIFSCPGFLRITKKENSLWENIIQDLDT